MRFLIEWPDQQPPPMETFNILIACGAALSQIPTPNNLVVPNSTLLSEKELSLALDASLAEKTSPASAVFKRIRKQVNAR